MHLLTKVKKIQLAHVSLAMTVMTMTATRVLTGSYSIAKKGRLTATSVAVNIISQL